MAGGLPPCIITILGENPLARTTMLVKISCARCKGPLMLNEDHIGRARDVRKIRIEHEVRPHDETDFRRGCIRGAGPIHECKSLRGFGTQFQRLAPNRENLPIEIRAH